MLDLASLLSEGARLLLFILPAYVANASPVLLGGQWPVDFNFRLPDRRPLFGQSKTWLGLLSGLCCGLLTAILLARLLPGTAFDLWAGQSDQYILAGFLLSAGAMAGDLIGSFIKRRLNQPSGHPSFILDQLAFLLLALLFVLPLRPDFVFAPAALLFLVVATYGLHRMANAFAHGAGLKKVPW